MLPMHPRLNRLHRMVLPLALIALCARPSSFSTQGDRVRYLSAERNEWEELPASLVDWTATEKYEKDRAAGAAVPEAVELDKQVETELEAGETALPQVAPGLRLPEDAGVFLLDTFQGQPQLIEVQQTAGDVNRNTKRNILRGAINPVGSAKQRVELEGEHATVQAHATVPALYIKLDDDLPAKQPLTKDQAGRGSQGQERTPGGDQSEKGSHGSDRTAAQPTQQPQQPERPIVSFERFRIVHAHVKGGKRVVGDIKVAVYGKVSQDQRFVKTTINNVTGGWLKLTPTEDLAPGEYALVEMVDKEGMNLYMWDFGVNPKAPANANAWKAETPAARSVPANGNPTEPRE